MSPNREWDGIERRITSDERLRGIELQVTRLVAHSESDAGNIGRLLLAQSTKIDKFEASLDKHKEDDNLNFKRIDRTISIASGVVIAVVFIVRIMFK